MSEVTQQITLKKGTATAYMLQFCKERGVNLLIITTYVSQSDEMNIYDATQLCQILLNEGTLKLKDKPEIVQWQFPQYWAKLFQGPVSRMVFQ
jgi:hypothetical protein